MASFNEKSLPPVPYKTAVVNAQGFLSIPWQNFFRQLWNRAGGGEAPSNAELDAQTTIDLTDVQDAISAINTAVSALQAVDPSGLTQGPRL